MGCTNTNNASSSKNTSIPKIKAGAYQLRQIYEIDPKILGSGSFGKVFQAVNKSDSSVKVAIKVIQKTKLEPEEIEAIHQEVAILQTLDHPNIVKYYETYDDVKYIYLVMELCNGGELFERISKSKGSLSENQIAHIMEKLLRAIIHCHSQNICHRDIKPENIMYSDQGDVKFIDFGLAKQTQRKHSKMHTVAGTPYFIAPEVLNGDYDKSCDIWSLGVVLYVLITGKYPFDGGNRAEVFAKIKKGEFDFSEETKKKMSPECLDIVKKMIVIERSKRLNGEQLLQHAWFEKTIKKKKGHEEILDAEVIQNLQNYRGRSTLKKAAMNVFIKMLSNKEVESLQIEFEKIDKDNSGIIDIQELKSAMEAANFKMSANEIQNIITELDYQGNHQINYTEFLAATISVRKFLTHQKLEALFKQFDLDGNNEISGDEIKSALQKMGRGISDAEIEEIMLRHDVSGDRVIQLEEFKRMMLEQES